MAPQLRPRGRTGKRDKFPLKSFHIDTTVRPKEPSLNSRSNTLFPGKDTQANISKGVKENSEWVELGELLELD